MSIGLYLRSFFACASLSFPNQADTPLFIGLYLRGLVCLRLSGLPNQANAPLFIGLYLQGRICRLSATRRLSCPRFETLALAQTEITISIGPYLRYQYPQGIGAAGTARGVCFRCPRPSKLKAQTETTNCIGCLPPTFRLVPRRISRTGWLRHNHHVHWTQPFRLKWRGHGFIQKRNFRFE